MTRQGGVYAVEAARRIKKLSAQKSPGPSSDEPFFKRRAG